MAERRELCEYQRRLGEQLRRVREEQRLTLEVVGVLSQGRFKRETLGAPTSAATGPGRLRRLPSWRGSMGYRLRTCSNKLGDYLLN